MDEQAKDPRQGSDPDQDLAARRRAFGAMMRQVREDKGLTAQALAQLTRINQQYIEALEGGSLERLPGAVFGRGFVRCIMKNIQVDGEAYLAEFNACWAEVVPSSVLKVEIKSKPPKRHAEAMAKSIATMQSLVRRGIIWKAAVPVVAVVVVVVGVRMVGSHFPKVAWGNLLHFSAASVSTPEASTVQAKELDLQPVASQDQPVALQPEVAKSEEPVATTAKAAEGATSAVPLTPPASSSAPVEAPAAANTQVLELTVIAPVRVRLDVDKGQPVTKELQPDTYRFSFNDKADLLIYDAAALKISFNGKPLGSLGSKGRVRRLSFQAEVPETSKNR